jgi:hypothetical protein
VWGWTKKGVQMSQFGFVAASYAASFAAGGLAGLGWKLRKNRPQPGDNGTVAALRGAVDAATELVAAARADMADMSRVLLGGMRTRVSQLVDDPLVRCALLEYVDDLADMIACRGSQVAVRGAVGASGVGFGPAAP